MSDRVYLTDRTTIETDWKCGMARWWFREEGGGGIVPASTAAYLTQGIEVHDDLAALAQGVEVEALVTEILATPAETQPELEVLYRRAGWIAGFGLYILPRLLDRYEVVFIERELCLARDPLWIACKPDLVLRDKQTGRLVVIDYKTAGMVTKGWVEYWPYAVQHHINLQAVADELGESPSHAQIIGLVKGQDRDGRLAHPYVWAYVKGDGSDPEQWSQKYAYGLTHAPVWEYTPGLLEWVKRLGEGVALAQFPHSAPIVLNERLLKDLIRSRTEREREVAKVRAVCQDSRIVRAQYFEQRFSACRPVIGAPCAYCEACHNASVNADPIGSGLYVPRTPHHELELLGGPNDE